MKRFGICMFVVSTAFATAQEVHREVAPGREFRDSKVLTPGQVDVWHIDAVKDEVLRCRCSANDLDPVLDLVDADGNVLRSDDGKGSQSVVRFRMPENGKVSFRVRGFQGAGGGRYELRLTRYIAPEHSVGGEHGGRFGREQWAHVRLHLDEGERFLPTVSGGRVTLVTRLQDDRSLQATLGAYTAPEAGEYHVRIEGRHKQRFSLRTHAPTYRAATVGEETVADIAAHGLDILRLEVPRGLAVTFDLAMPTQRLQQWHRLLGKEPKWQELIASSKGGRSRRMFWSKHGLALELWLHNDSATPACYTFVPRPVDAALASPRGGRLPLGDVACHPVTVKVGEVVSLKVRSTCFDPCLRVCDPRGIKLGDADDQGPLDRTASMTFHAQHAGTHRILVYSAGGGGSGDYEVEVVRHEVPTLAVGGSLALRCAPDANGYAHLRLVAGQEVWLSVRSAAVDSALTLFDDRGKRLKVWEGGGVGGDVLGAIRAERTGVCTLFVHARSGRGSCTLRALAVE